MKNHASTNPSPKVARALAGSILCLLSASVCESAPVVVIYNTAGTTSFTAPVGVFTIQAETWGGGGAGGSGRKDISGGGNTSQNGGGGGGGAYAARLAVPVGLLPSYTIVIPAAAVSGTNGTTTNGQGRVNGSDVTFVGDSGVTITAAGGTGGANAYTTSNATVGAGGGAGGTVALSVGDSGYVFAGGAGSAGNNGSTNVSGSGGGGAGTTAAGGNAVTFTSPTSPTPPPPRHPVSVAPLAVVTAAPGATVGTPTRALVGTARPPAAAVAAATIKELAPASAALAAWVS